MLPRAILDNTFLFSTFFTKTKSNIVHINRFDKCFNRCLMEVSFHLKKKIKEKKYLDVTLVAVRWRCTFVPSFRKDDPLPYLLRHVVEGRYYCIIFCFSDSCNILVACIFRGRWSLHSWKCLTCVCLCFSLLQCSCKRFRVHSSTWIICRSRLSLFWTLTNEGFEAREPEC